MSEEGRERAGRVYWRSNLRLLTVLLAIWFACSFGLGILLVEPLNRIQVGGFPLGFWFAQQGSIYIFILLILVYAVLMDRADRRYSESLEQHEPRDGDGNRQA
jgi:putative solute:sodium symporter small subunit